MSMNARYHQRLPCASITTRRGGRRLRPQPSADDPARAIAKRFATDVGFEVAKGALQLYGGYGYLSKCGVEKIVRDLRVHQLEGTPVVAIMAGLCDGWGVGIPAHCSRRVVPEPRHSQCRKSGLASCPTSDAPTPLTCAGRTRDARRPDCRSPRSRGRHPSRHGRRLCHELSSSGACQRSSIRLRRRCTSAVVVCGTTRGRRAKVRAQVDVRRLRREFARGDPAQPRPPTGRSCESSSASSGPKLANSAQGDPESAPASSRAREPGSVSRFGIQGSNRLPGRP